MALLQGQGQIQMLGLEVRKTHLCNEKLNWVGGIGWANVVVGWMGQSGSGVGVVEWLWGWMGLNGSGGGLGSGGVGEKEWVG